MPLIIVHNNKGISTMVNGTLLNFGKRYENDLRVIFDQWSKLCIGLDVEQRSRKSEAFCRVQSTNDLL